MGNNTDPLFKPDFQIGPIPVFGDVILAPMDGISDLPFRVLTRQMGSSVNITGFVNTDDILRNSHNLKTQLAFNPALERPLGFQIFGSDPHKILDAAVRLQDHDPDFIDINMGCSAKVIRRKGAGSELLASPSTIALIFKLLSSKLTIPVTGKIRLGLDDSTRNYIEIAHIIEDNGGKMLAVHARTRSQAYSGKADWLAIGEIKQAVSIPVVGNGDITSPEQIVQLRTLTGCDAVMIGRAAVGNPWLFAHSHRNQQNIQEIYNVIMAHMKSMVDFYGEQTATLLFRKHLKHYVSPFNPSRKHLTTLLQAKTITDVRANIDAILDQGVELTG
jgi:nifR3 family TIM-barrel protein